MTLHDPRARPRPSANPAFVTPDLSAAAAATTSSGDLGGREHLGRPAAWDLGYRTSAAASRPATSDGTRAAAAASTPPRIGTDLGDRIQTATALSVAISAPAAVRPRRGGPRGPWSSISVATSSAAATTSPAVRLDEIFYVARFVSLCLFTLVPALCHASPGLLAR